MRMRQAARQNGRRCLSPGIPTALLDYCVKGSEYQVVIFSAGLFMPAADGSQWDVSTPHAWRLEERAAWSFPRPAPGPAERDKRHLLSATCESPVKPQTTNRVKPEINPIGKTMHGAVAVAGEFVLCGPGSPRSERGN